LAANSIHWTWWIYFNLFVLIMLVLDLKVFHRTSHEIRIKEALGWTAFWVSLAMLFCLGLYIFQDRLFPAEIAAGQHPALEFLTGYFIEESLSIDNLFVFLMVFTFFNVQGRYQHKVLFWGIIGAIIMRAAFILLGVQIIQRLHWAIYIFGIFLIVTGIKMAFHQDKEIHPEKNPVIKIVRRFFPVSEKFDEGRFFTRQGGKLLLTPLFIVLLVLETTDVIFAVDSIPAILAITLNPFIAYTSNLFAVLGLRSLYFALAGMMQMFHYLSHGLAAVLTFIGVKMLISDIYKIPTGIALGVVLGTILISVAASMLFPAKKDIQP
jgi:tellurite resistance protein TerC